MHLDSAPQCMAYILDKWPRSVLLVRIWMRPIGSIEPAACAKVVSQAAFLPSYYVYVGLFIKQRKISVKWDEWHVKLELLLIQKGRWIMIIPRVIRDRSIFCNNLDIGGFWLLFDFPQICVVLDYTNSNLLTRMAFLSWSASALSWSSSFMFA